MGSDGLTRDATRQRACVCVCLGGGVTDERHPRPGPYFSQTRANNSTCCRHCSPVCDKWLRSVLWQLRCMELLGPLRYRTCRCLFCLIFIFLYVYNINWFSALAHIVLSLGYAMIHWTEAYSSHSTDTHRYYGSVMIHITFNSLSPTPLSQ